MKILITIVAALAVLAGLVFGGAYVYYKTSVFAEHHAEQRCVEEVQKNMLNPDSYSLRDSKVSQNEDGSYSVELSVMGSNRFGGIVTQNHSCVTLSSSPQYLDIVKTREANEKREAWEKLVREASR